MARCGCAAGCSCLVVGSSPLVVTGNGSPGAPFTVSISYGGKTGCAGIAACVGANLGPGLTYDLATSNIQALVSRDADNGLTFGSDNGLYASGTGGGGGGPTCQKSVASLPLAPKVAGAWSMAGLMGPYNSPYQVDYCVANGIDIVHFTTCATSDGVAFISEYDTGQLAETRCSVYETGPVRYTDSATVQSIWNYAGDLNDPYPGPGRGTSGDRAPGSGWYGWLAPNYFQWTLPQLLARLGGKSVALADCRDAGEPDNVEADNVQAALRAVRDYCAQKWTMIGVQSLANASTVLNAGVEAIMMVKGPDTGWGTTALPYTVASLLAAGVKWVALSHYYANSVFTAYKNAGINVLMWGASRHSDRTRLEGLGIRGFLGHDPVYTRGPAVSDYRKTRDPWSRRRMGNGQLTHVTDQTGVVGPDVRGYHRHPGSGALGALEGLMLPARWGNGGGSPNVLCGWECPLQNPTSYTISVEMQYDTVPTGTTAKLGLLFGMATDEGRFGWNGADGNPLNMPARRNSCYRAFQRVNGEIGLGVFAADGTYTDLQVVSSPAVSADVWNTYLLTVTPTQLTFRRTTGTGGVYTVTAAHSTFRGGYFAVEKEELHPESTQYSFIGGFRNLVVGGQGDA